jgi:CRISPR/Cas system CMR subunit Cmr4 (Cas7 group RAMP superfamily)
VSTIQLSDDIQVDPSQITSVTFEEKGAKISGNAVTVGSGGDWGDLRVPEDSLIVRLIDGSEFVIRGEQEAKRALDVLKQAKNQGQFKFEVGNNQPS